MSEIKDNLAEKVAQPKQATVDGTTVVQHSVEEQIAADQYTQPLAQQKPRYRQFRHRGAGF